MTTTLFKEEQTNFFKERVKSFQDLLNLKDWRIEVSPTISKKKVYAEVGMFLEDRLAVIKLGSGWSDKELTNQNLSDVALHEVLHVFLRTYQAACVSRRPEWMNTEEHALVVILEKLLHENLSPP